MFPYICICNAVEVAVLFFFQGEIHSNDETYSSKDSVVPLLVTGELKRIPHRETPDDTNKCKHKMPANKRRLNRFKIPRSWQFSWPGCSGDDFVATIDLSYAGRTYQFVSTRERRIQKDLPLIFCFSILRDGKTLTISPGFSQTSRSSLTRLPSLQTSVSPAPPSTSTYGESLPHSLFPVSHDTYPL